MASSLLAQLFLLLLITFIVVENRPTFGDLGNRFSSDPALLARLEQMMGAEFAEDGRLFNLQRLG